MKTKTSRITGFYKNTLDQRIHTISQWANLSNTETNVLRNILSLSTEDASHMVENAIGTFSLPLGIGTNFLINNTDYLIPMAIEEPSVIAAVSNAARLFREGGGFTTHSDEPIMIGQIQLLDINDPEQAVQIICEHKHQLIEEANRVSGSIVARGGGAIDIETRIFTDTPIGSMVIIHLLYDTREAMGANAINTAVEHLAPFIEEITGGRVNLRILSNLTDKRKAYAEGMIPAQILARNNVSGKQVVRSIVEAGIFAEIDPYRATTHNKGIMNGIDAVLIATGNDWRAVEAGVHAYAARSGTYSSLSKWWQDDDGNLRGSIELPLAVGTVGGATRVHPTAKVVMKILGNPSSRELAEIIATVGLAQNLGALRALATEGIQHGHMRMHARQLAVAAGASNEQVSQVAHLLVEENKIRLQRAKEIVAELQDKNQ
ncbi:MAG: hydroxymethylglutaryl-CoA reductase, degradative [Anaerolineae bacterium]|nr:hydroxymethylglutaryl-CoA reductase, degradative [Anaerolineae bacterium]